MNGYQVTFFNRQDRHHDAKQMHEWHAGVRGSTVLMDAEGTDHTGRRQSFRFFELANQPIEMTIAMTAEQSKTPFPRLGAEKVNLFDSQGAGGVWHRRGERLRSNTFHGPCIMSADDESAACGFSR